jgi:hypothetical protein
MAGSVSRLKDTLNIQSNLFVMMSNKKWNRDEVAYLVDNYGKMSLEDLSRELNRSVMAVRLYALRHRLDDKHQVVKENRLKKLLEYRFRHLEDFHPSKYFFKETGINQVRYWDLFFGRKPIKPQEYKAVAEYFCITISEAFDSLQLNLFDQ